MKAALTQIFLSLSLTLLSGTAFARDFICWDGTFAYNVTSFAETENRFELTLTGADLGPLTFRSHPTVALERWERGNKIYLPFRKDECQDDGTQITCKHIASSFRDNLYVEHSVDDLGERTSPISEVYAKEIVATLIPGHSTKVIFLGARLRAKNEIDVQELNTWHMGQCDQHFGSWMTDAVFPERLRKHLDSKTSQK